MTDTTQSVVEECERQSENCAYTAITFIIWLRYLKVIKVVCILLQIILATTATWQIVKELSPWIAATAASLSTLIAVAYSALNVDATIAEYKRMAGEYTNLRDCFRRAGKITAKRDVPLFETEVAALLLRLEAAHRIVLTPPEWCFKEAQRKYNTGDYKNEVDINAS